MTDARGAKRPKGRTLAEFEPLSTAERKLLGCAAAGAIADFGIKPPQTANDANTVRGEFIRFLALGGDEAAPVHEKGVQLRGAWIEDEFDLEGVETKGGLYLVESAFEAAPVFRDARIKGSLALSGSKMPGLHGDRLTCDGSLFLSNKLDSTGEVRLVGAKIGGALNCSGGAFKNEGGNALNADGINVVGDVFLGATFKAAGEVRLLGAKIGGDLNFSGGSFQNQETHALAADGINVGGSVFMAKDFKAVGEVRLLGAKIGSILDCSGGTFKNEGGDALSADRIDVAGGVFMGDTFKATGTVRLLGAKIGSNLNCSGGTFQNQEGYALSADGLNVGGSMFIGEKFNATETVRLLRAKIGGSLVLRRGGFRGNPIAIDMEGANVGSGLMIDSVRIEEGVIDLSSATVSQLVDHSETWDKGVVLNGFVYNAISGDAPTDAKMRIGWLDKQSDVDRGKDGKGAKFQPQPWQQLRKVLREMGHYEAAREVGIAFEQRKRQCGLIGQTPEISVGQALRAVGGWVYGKTARLLHIGYGALVGYGYRPLRLLMISTVVWLVFGGGYFAAARWDGAFVPSTQALFSRYGGTCGLPAHARWTDCKAIRLEYPQFYPLAYSLNVLLPVGNLGQEGTWRPETGTWGGRIAQFAVWFETLFGWMAGLILVAVVSGLAKRDE